ncbi:unnamed protein product [Prorocentrum cordatum]|uniref:Protein ENHANCED DISEASE RESISTANCE 2 C-terminal domain-containing protein n=1 Tax=Prorocentrum cordatum TaxID=2364126 RepID=A0ABN9WN23_9DINO|nr:unnamed protein product [Polarella glacialis]
MIAACLVPSLAAQGAPRATRTAFGPQRPSSPRPCGPAQGGAPDPSAAAAAAGPLALSALVAERLALAGDPAGADGPPAAGLASWAEGDAALFRLRRGPRYRALRRKGPAGTPLYRCVGADVVRGGAQIRSALSQLRGRAGPGGAADAARAPAPLPRFVLVNFQVPHQAGPVYGDHPPGDTGTSVLLFFEVRPEAASLSRSLDAAPAGVRLLARFLREGGHPKAEGTMVSSCFKAVGVLENLECLDIPAFMMPAVRAFNGKPVLVEKESQRYTLGPDVVELATSGASTPWHGRCCAAWEAS